MERLIMPYFGYSRYPMRVRIRSIIRLASWRSPPWLVMQRTHAPIVSRVTWVVVIYLKVVVRRAAHWRAVERRNALQVGDVEPDNLGCASGYGSNLADRFRQSRRGDIAICRLAESPPIRSLQRFENRQQDAIWIVGLGTFIETHETNTGGAR
jgi:hypothetical protein